MVRIEVRVRGVPPDMSFSYRKGWTMQFNKVMIAGNLTSDPVLTETKAGHTVCNMRIASNRGNKESERGEEVTFVDVTVWDTSYGGKQATVCSEYLSKGSLILVEGRLGLDEWNAEDGSKRSKHYVNASNIQFVGKYGRDREDQKESQLSPMEVGDAPF